MNEQRAPGGIEWTRINGRRGYTWNPTAGCMHGCTWRMPDGKVIECYAKTIAEGVARKAYPEGFEHHYWRPEQLHAPLKVKHPSGIFVGSMADLFGHWTPVEQIAQVMGIMQSADWHIFQTLSKYPNRVAELSERITFPDNVWAGVSLPAGHLMSESGAERALAKYLGHMSKVRARTRFMSIEPLWFDVATVFERWLDYHGVLPFEWAIIGAASDGPRYYQPEPDWLIRLLEILDDQSIPVFFKGNLRWPETRADFPPVHDKALSE